MTPVRPRFRVPAAALGALLCLGCDEEAPLAPVSDVPQGWPRQMQEAPDDVLAHLAADNDGWAALFQGDLVTASAARSPDVVARAQIETALLRDTLVDLQTLAWSKLLAEWTARGGLPNGTALHTMAALSALDAGQDPAPFLALGPPPLDPRWAAIHSAMAVDLPETDRLAFVASHVAPPLGECLLAHVAARKETTATPNDVPGIEAACPSPYLWENNGARTAGDPLLARTLALRSPRPPAPAHPLSATLFSGRWSVDDPPDATGPTAQRLGFAPASTAADALAVVQHANQVLDTWAAPQTAPGHRLSSELLALEVYRAQVVVDWVASGATSPEASREALRAVYDTTAARTLGPRNPPRAAALTALAAVATGHGRDALPALRSLAPLSPLLPELAPLTELVNDLHVATTIGRGGDSKEP